MLKVETVTKKVFVGKGEYIPSKIMIQIQTITYLLG